MRYWRSALSSMVMVLALAAGVLAQGLELPHGDIPLQAKKYKPPAWIKPGLTVYYHCTGGVNNKPSGNFWTVYLVEYVDEERVAGVVYSINPGTATVTTQTWMSLGGSGNFYLNRQMLRDSAQNPEQGLQITEHTLIYEHQGGKIQTIFDDNGLITGMHSVQVSGQTKNVSVVQYKAHETLQRPNLAPEAFPRQAAVGHVYVQQMVMMGNRVPFAQITIQPGKVVGGAVAAYKMTLQQTPRGGIQMPAQTFTQYGTKVWGPFYLHPELLKTGKVGMTVLEFKTAQYKEQVTAIQNGQLRIDASLGGRPVGVKVYNLSNGLLAYQIHSIAGSQIVTQLAR